MSFPATPTPVHVNNVRWIALWLFSGLTAFFIGLRDLGGTSAGGAFVPADYDSFYHARRILDAVANLSHFYQFDPRIHAPEGSWVTWPWAYDFLCAVFVKAGLAIGLAKDPMALLAFIAPLSVFASAGLLVALCRRLHLAWPAATLVMLMFATSQLTRALHRVGMVDHHYVEQMFVLATLYAGLGWCQQGASTRRAALLGGVLGLAPAFHNGDFILQLPVLATLALLWWQGRLPPRLAIQWFAGTLVVTTFIVLLPSTPFRTGMFTYTLLSWFHGYVAAGTAAMVLLLSFLRPTRSALLLLVATAALALVPLVAEMELAAGFLGGSLEQLERMEEVQSLWSFLRHEAPGRLSALYSCLLWLLPLGLGWLLGRVWRVGTPAALFLAIFSLFGALLLLMQFRLHYFGSFVLWLGPALALQESGWLSRRVRPARGQWLVAGCLAGAATPGVLPLDLHPPLGGTATYQNFRPLFLLLGEQCAQAPGIVLANNNLGHYLTFHTDCPVVADNFILTRQHEAKLRLVHALFAGRAEALQAKAPWLRYVLAERGDNPVLDGCFPACAANAGLRHELLETTGPLPPGWALVAEMAVTVAGRQEPLARVYRLPATSPRASVALRQPSPVDAAR